jgi:hypothetical protein
VEVNAAVVAVGFRLFLVKAVDERCDARLIAGMDAGAGDDGMTDASNSTSDCPLNGFDMVVAIIITRHQRKVREVICKRVFILDFI